MKKIIKITIGGLILVLLLTSLNKSYRFKYGDGIYGLETFYDLEENSLDMLVLGSSHAFENINPAILYREQGIAAYDLCGSVQPMWNTYYYLKEALKTQTPKLILLEAYAVSSDQDYSDSSRIIKNTYGMKWSKDKIDAIKISSPPEETLDFIIGPLQYHSRYKELDKTDFLPHLGNEGMFETWKGFGCNMETLAQVPPSSLENAAPVALTKKTEEYFRKTIELAQSQEIPLMVIVSPYGGITEYQQGKYLSAETIAKEYNVPFINYNFHYNDIGLDFNTDFADGDHLNYIGNEKFTVFLGNYVNKTYTLPDRRNDRKYKSWDTNLKYYEQSLQGKELQAFKTMDEYVSNLPTENCVTIITSTDTVVPSALDNVLNEESFPQQQNNICIIQDGTVIYSNAGTTEFTWFKNLDNTDIAVKRTNVPNQDNNGTSINYKINIGLAEYLVVQQGINIVTYNTFTSEVVDYVGFDGQNEFAMVR